MMDVRAGTVLVAVRVPALPGVAGAVSGAQATGDRRGVRYCEAIPLAGFARRCRKETP
jgi:hypothetical protein